MARTQRASGSSATGGGGASSSGEAFRVDTPPRGSAEGGRLNWEPRPALCPDCLLREATWCGWRRMGFAALLILWATGGRLCAGDQDGNGPAFRQSIAADLTDRFHKASAAHPEDPLVQEAAARLEMLDQVVARILARFDRNRSAVVSSLMEPAVGVSVRKKGGLQSEAEEARAILSQYQAGLSRDLPPAPPASTDLGAVREYYLAATQAAERAVLERGQALDGLGLRTAAELGIVVPMLVRPDRQWDRQLVAGLPEWMLKAESLKVAEDVALSAVRPVPAYLLWVQQFSGGGAADANRAQYVAHLDKKADLFFGSKDFLKGISCLKSAVLLADQESLANTAVRLRFRLAEVYQIYGHAQLSAEEVKGIMNAYPASPEYGRAALMRLMYLYHADQFQKIIEEAPALLEDPGTKTHRPQILYIAWVSYRRENKMDDADRMEKAFLAAYPDYSLAADMHFARAMASLAGGKYDEASQALEMIQERFPDSSVAAKAKDIKSRLATARNAGAAASQPKAEGVSGK
jgi:tetratricopeptide (TPR) repeat protein